MTDGVALNQVVLVSGAPGTGKTTLAVPLAQALGFPLISKDHIKEAVWDMIRPPTGSLAWSRATGGAAMETLWWLGGLLREVVLEANFRPYSDYEVSRTTALAKRARLVEVHCWCPPETAMHRYTERAARTQHHAAHVGQVLTNDTLAEFDRPMSVGPVLTVDTSQQVDASALSRQVAAALKPVTTSAQVPDDAGSEQLLSRPRWSEAPEL